MSRPLIAAAAAVAGLVAGPLIGAARAQPAEPAPLPTAPPPPASATGQPAPAAVSATDPAAPPAGSATDPTAPPPANPTDPMAPVPASAAEPAAQDDEIGDQAVSAALGLAAGGRVTPGGLRINGHYLYQLSERDWFDGTASFTFGSGRAACFRDRTDQLVCNHGLADGAHVELSVGIRRLFAPQGAFRPFARIGVGIGVARFSDDDVSGFTIPLHGGGGVRVKVAPAIAIVAEGELELGLGSFGRGIGLAPQLGLAVTAGVEFRLR